MYPVDESVVMVLDSSDAVAAAHVNEGSEVVAAVVVNVTVVELVVEASAVALPVVIPATNPNGLVINLFNR